MIGLEQRGALLAQLEDALTALAAREGELRLSIPMAYLEGLASGSALEPG